MLNKEHAARAQIFQPFDSLKGFNELLKQQEQQIVERKILSVDDRMELDRRIHLVRKGRIIRIVYYNGKNYIRQEGMVAKINLEMNFIQIVQTKIDIRDIIEIEGEGLERPYY